MVRAVRVRGLPRGASVRCRTTSAQPRFMYVSHRPVACAGSSPFARPCEPGTATALMGPRPSALTAPPAQSAAAVPASTSHQSRAPRAAALLCSPARTFDTRLHPLHLSRSCPGARAPRAPSINPFLAKIRIRGRRLARALVRQDRVSPRNRMKGRDAHSSICSRDIKKLYEEYSEQSAGVPESTLTSRRTHRC